MIKKNKKMQMKEPQVFRAALSLIIIIFSLFYGFFLPLSLTSVKAEIIDEEDEAVEEPQEEPLDQPAADAEEPAADEDLQSDEAVQSAGDDESSTTGKPGDGNYGFAPLNQVPPNIKDAQLRYFDGRYSPWPSLDEIACRSYIVIDAETGEEILAKNPDDVAYPASMTKILTCITVIEHPDFDPDRPVHFSERAVAMPHPLSSNCGFVAGEEMATLPCLYAMMLQSANDVANALGETYGGSIEGFAELMNAKAAEIGCPTTHFVDPAGFGLEDHYTTAREMAEISRYAMQNPLFRDIVNSRVILLPPTNKHKYPGWHTCFNGNGLFVCQDAGYQSEYLKSIDGIKPGTTDIAGFCLTAAATTYDNRKLIAVIFDGNLICEDGQWIAASALDYVLLHEAAKKLKCPPGEPDYSGDYHKVQWALNLPPINEKYGYSVQTEPAESSSETQTEAETRPIVTRALPKPTGKYVPESSVVFKPIHIILISLVFILLLLISWFAGRAVRKNESGADADEDYNYDDYGDSVYKDYGNSRRDNYAVRRKDSAAGNDLPRQNRKSGGRRAGGKNTVNDHRRRGARQAVTNQRLRHAHAAEKADKRFNNSSRNAGNSANQRAGRNNYNEDKSMRHTQNSRQIDPYPYDEVYNEREAHRDYLQQNTADNSYYGRDYQVEESASTEKTKHQSPFSDKNRR